MKPKIIIVGGGPAGLATALHLAQRAPHLAAETLLLEAKQYPRPKLCGGGVTIHGEEQLEALGLTIDAPAFTANRLVFRLGKRTFKVDHQHAMRVFDRADFDAALAQAVFDRGVCVHTDERLLEVQPTADGVTVTTNRDQYHARVVIATDGANSTVRRKLAMRSTIGVARLLRVLTPVDPHNDPAWQSQTAEFDFSCVTRGIQGYMWDFPCIVDGKPAMNRGIYDSRIAANGAKDSLKETFFDGLAARGVDPAQVILQGHPVRWFDPTAEFSRPHILLAGDAAGVDPLFAEGISYGMEYGSIVAEAIEDAFTRGDFGFADYRSQLLKHRLGRLLRRRTALASQLYQYRYPSFWELLWRAAAIAPYPIQRRMGASVALLPG